jgi:hypothetical protein
VKSEATILARLEKIVDLFSANIEERAKTLAPGAAPSPDDIGSFSTFLGMIVILAWVLDQEDQARQVLCGLKLAQLAAKAEALLN